MGVWVCGCMGVGVGGAGKDGYVCMCADTSVSCSVCMCVAHFVGCTYLPSGMTLELRCLPTLTAQRTESSLSRL